jgi:hypothetical protein
MLSFAEFYFSANKTFSGKKVWGGHKYMVAPTPGSSTECVPCLKEE